MKGMAALHDVCPWLAEPGAYVWCLAQTRNWYRTFQATAQKTVGNFKENPFGESCPSPRLIDSGQRCTMFDWSTLSSRHLNGIFGSICPFPLCSSQIFRVHVCIHVSVNRKNLEQTTSIRDATKGCFSQFKLLSVNRSSLSCVHKSAMFHFMSRQADGQVKH